MVVIIPPKKKTIQLKKGALGLLFPAQVRMPVKKFAISLNRRYHAGQHVVATQQAPGFGLESRPSARRAFTQPLAISAGVQWHPET